MGNSVSPDLTRRFTNCEIRVLQSLSHIFLEAATIVLHVVLSDVLIYFSVIEEVILETAIMAYLFLVQIHEQH